MEQTFPLDKKSWTYQEWVLFFEHIKKNPISDKDLKKVALISLDYQKELEGKLDNCLCETVNCMVNRAVKSFSDKLEFLIEFNEMELLEFTFQKFQYDIRKCLFFEQLKVVSDDMKQTLSANVKTWIQTDWKKSIKKWAYDNILESKNPALEDILYLLDKERIFH